MSAFGGKADMNFYRCPLSRSLLGVKRTCVAAPHESAFDPKRTSNLSFFTGVGAYRVGTSHLAVQVCAVWLDLSPIRPCDSDLLASADVFCHCFQDILYRIHALCPSTGQERRIWSPIMTEPTIADAANEIVAWYAMPIDEVMKKLTTNTEKGLGATEASSRLEKYGPNRLPEGKKRGPFMRFVSQFNNILVFVLLAAGFIKLMLNLWVDAAIIFGVVILNALLGFVQEGKAEKALDSIRNMLSAEARTIRDGETRMISAEELVPGDVVLLESGDKVPADLRLAEVKNLRTEEAALTGESVPADKGTDSVSRTATVGDRESMAFSGTMVVSGRATGLVVATGSETELGRINQLLTGVSALETPLLRQIKKFGYAITAVVAIVGVLVFAYGKWVRGIEFVELFQAVVGIAVSLIPEGLPALITITLAIGVQRMARHSLGGVRCGVEATIREGAHHTGTRRRSRPNGAHRGGLGQVNSAGRDAEYNLERKRTSSTSSAGLLKRRAVDTYPRYGWARPGHACLWTDILNPL